MLAGSAPAAVIYDELVRGDFSDSYLAPTPIVFGIGVNQIIGKLNGASMDLDLFTVTIPEGMFLTAIRVKSFTGGVVASFMGVQPGAVLSTSPFDYIRAGMGEPVVVGEINYVLFGGADALEESDLMPQLVVGNPLGGKNPLPAGEYAFWLNETRALSTYTLGFEVVPEPGVGVLVMMSSVVFLWRVRRRV